MTSSLAAGGLSVLAAEPNPDFDGALAALRPLGVTAVRARVQELPPDIGRFDAVLLSYVLDSVPEEEIRAVHTALRRVVAPGGCFLGVTYAEQSPWRTYSAAVEADIGPCLSGGRTRVFTALEQAGRTVLPLVTVTTGLYAASPYELFDGLAFFYRRRLTAYRAARERLLPRLARLAVTGGGVCRLAVDEVVFEWS
ncbi:class I SAM-dependent methyltransferase [Streptomyces sp. NPDC059168]|uniref:class I SAM-dependent methyltransferase n=1 Tax=Streptomyces sp. NPDC059168 TaxID=3346753 RepID=UPI0036CFF565